MDQATSTKQCPNGLITNILSYCINNLQTSHRKSESKDFRISNASKSKIILFGNSIFIIIFETLFINDELSMRTVEKKLSLVTSPSLTKISAVPQ